MRNFFGQHCLDCHSDGTSEGGLDINALSEDLTDAETMRRWVLIHDRVASGEMPPDEDSLTDEAKNRFIDQLAGTLYDADSAHREVVLRRLNRVEYENTLRDLFELPHVDIKEMLPEDAKSHGFNNIGEALSVSTEQMMVYLQAIDHVLDEAIGPPERPETRVKTLNLKESAQRALGKLFRDEPDGVVLFSSGYSPSQLKGFDTRVPGWYRFKIHARAFQSDRPMTLRVYAGDVIGGRGESWLAGYYDVAPGEAWTVIELEQRLEPRGSIQVTTYRNGGHETNAAETDRSGILIGDVQCEGPIIDAWPPPSRVKLLGDVDPDTATAEDAVAILKRFLPFAYRRTTEPQEVEPFAKLTRRVLDDGRPWTEALRQGMKAILISPEFLFLEEPTRNQISDFAIASRLSYFLWKSMPDAELLSLAARGHLSRPDVLHAQVERLLNDRRAERFVEDFTGQWLDLYDIDFTEPDKHLFPEYDDILRASMLSESRGFFREILANNLNVGEFLDSDWTVLNSRLAEHYGLPDVEGLHDRRVKLSPDSPRGGVMTQAAVLKVTANGTNTSPVLRGIWMRENVFGEPVPPPPAGVPAVEPDISGATTLREQLAKHSDSASCAGCHDKIDPPGFALERFDPIGGWRDWYRSTTVGEPIKDRFADSPINKVRVRYRKGLPVDASGVTPDGHAFEDFREFKRILAADQEPMAYNLAEKLLAFGLGRTTGFSDRPTLQKIVAKTADDNHGFRTLIHEVVQSDAFRKP
ncbi:DUF1592 domain-containing protein [Neorhodopirellula pilleata]|uniref:DUF1592 domain-containing protein n=1 Tax=Neorhodopirellula pilleata TaxID=2714738 RepID=UPI0018CD5A79|nr:DUF1592 domain-containing protein [Neorhodopirellula pilleata]